MSKQDIEKRLGFAAQGVKETTRTNAKAKFVRFMDLETWKNSKGTVFTAGIEDDAGRFQPYVTARDSSGGDQLQTRSAPTFKTEQGARKWLNTWLQNNKSTSSRPGVKAKMAAPANWESKLDAKNLADSFNVEGLRELLGSAKEIARKYPQYKALGQKMADGINMILSAVKQMKAESIKASRLGVKAKMAKPQFRTKKLHNGYIAVEVNQGSGWERYDTTHEESWNGIEEYERGYQKAYDRGLRYSGGAWRIPSTTASRPGVKAKMGSSQVNDSATTADLIREAQRLRDVIKTSNREFDKTHLRQIKQELDKRGVLMPYGASEVLASRSGMKAKA